MTRLVHSNRIGVRSRQGGSALLIAMLLLVMMGMTGLAALETVSTDQRVAGFQGRKRLAFYAAEAAVAEALSQLEATGTPTVATRALGSSAIYPYGQPSYDLDSTTADPIEYLGAAPISGMNLQIGQEGGAKYQMQFWKIRVEGQAPGGSTSRIEVAAGKLVGS